MQTTLPQTIDIGVDESDRLSIAAELERVLADTFTLYLKTHNDHWNVAGRARCSPEQPLHDVSIRC